MAIEELLGQEPVTTYVIGQKNPIEREAELRFNNKSYVTSYEIRHGGLPINFKNYIKAFYSYDNNGSFIREIQDIGVAIPYKQNEKDRLLIKGEYIPEDPTDHIDLGFLDKDKDMEYYKGLQNSYYINSYLSYRMTIVTPFDARITSGKVVKIEFEEPDGTREISPIYSGNWLVCEVIRAVDKNSTYSQKLVLSKPKINVG
jgi:hypothetical protein